MCGHHKVRIPYKALIDASEKPGCLQVQFLSSPLKPRKNIKKKNVK